MDSDDDNALLRRGMQLIIGGQSRNVPPMTMGKSLAWREKLGPIIARVFADMGDIDNPEDVNNAYFQNPKDMASVVASYLGMEDEELLNLADEPEVMEAFARIYGIAIRPTLALESIQKAVSSARKKHREKAQEGDSPTSPTSPSPNGESVRTN